MFAEYKKVGYYKANSPSFTVSRIRVNSVFFFFHRRGHKSACFSYCAISLVLGVVFFL